MASESRKRHNTASDVLDSQCEKLSAAPWTCSLSGYCRSQETPDCSIRWTHKMQNFAVRLMPALWQVNTSSRCRTATEDNLRHFPPNCIIAAIPSSARDAMPVYTKSHYDEHVWCRISDLMIGVCYRSVNKDKQLLERIQHRFTRMLPGMKELPYTQRLRKLGLFGR